MTEGRELVEERRAKTPDAKSRRDRTRVMLAAVIVLGAILRLYHLGAHSLWYDEAIMVQFGELSGFSLEYLDPAELLEAPLPAVAVLLWRTVTFLDGIPRTSPWNDYLLRLLPALCSIGCIPLLYRAASEMSGDRRAGVIAAALFAISPFHIYYAQELRSYALTSLFALAALVFLLRVLESNRHRDYAGLAVAEVLMMYTHFTNLWSIVAFNIVALLAILQRRELLARWTLYQAGVVLVVLPVVNVARHANEFFLSVPHLWSDRVMPTTKTALITFKALFAGYSPAAWAYWPLFLLALVFTVAGVYALRRWPRHAVLVVLLIVLPVGVNVIFWRMRTLSLYEHRIFIFSGIVALIAVAHGIRMLPRPSWRIAVVAAFVVLSVPLLRDTYAHRLHPVLAHRIAVYDKVDFRPAAAHIARHWQEGDVLAHDGLFTLAPMQHYLPVEQYHLGNAEDAEIYSTYVAPEHILRRHGQLPVPGEEATAGADRVWLVEASGITFDAKPQTIGAREWLGEHFRLAEQTKFDGVRVYLYTR